MDKLESKAEEESSDTTTQVIWQGLKSNQRNDSVWTRLLERYRGRILVYSARLMGPEMRRVLDPEDVVNEAWMRVISHSDLFQHRGRRSLYRWLCTQVRRVILDRRRDLERRGPLPVPMADLPASGPPLDPQDSTMGPASRAQSYEAVHRVTEALERVPESYRGPLEAVYLQCRPRREVAAEYGISLNNLAQRIHRGLSAWRHELGGESIPL